MVSKDVELIFILKRLEHYYEQIFHPPFVMALEEEKLLIGVRTAYFRVHGIEPDDNRPCAKIGSHIDACVRGFQ